MAKTQRGAFDKTYHHIDAPTVQDEEYGKLFKKRRLSLKDFRSQELSYLSSNSWTYKRKLDGENIRVKWNGEQALWNGKTNKFQCSVEFENYMNETLLEEMFEEKFGRECEVYLYGEKMGPKTQGNELNLDKDEFILFDVEVNGTFLDEQGIIDVARFFMIRSCYDFMNIKACHSSLQQLIKDVADGIFEDWEGIVATPCCNIKDHNGKRIIVKIKNRDYLRNDDENR